MKNGVVRLPKGCATGDMRLWSSPVCHGRSAIEVADPPWVRRELFLEMELASLRNGVQFFTHRGQREAANLATLRRLLDETKPDAVLVWGMWNLPRSLPALAEEAMPHRVAYYFGDYWPTLPSQFEEYWQYPPRHWATALPKRILGAVALRRLAAIDPCRLEFEHSIFPTVFMQQELTNRGVAVGNAAVIYGGVDTRPYAVGHRRAGEASDGDFTFLYVGRLTHEKGVHTALEALSNVVHQRGRRGARLVIVGAGDDEYVESLLTLARREQIEDHVTFAGAQPKERLPELYARAQAFLFTSIWPEPFGRVLVEAMASGLVVIGTATGGAAEILSGEENALTFPPGNASSLAQQMVRLMDSPSLRKQLSVAGQHRAVENFDIRRMTAGIESYLVQVVDSELAS